MVWQTSYRPPSNVAPSIERSSGASSSASATGPQMEDAEIEEGIGHSGKSALIDLIARKRNA